MTDERYGIHTNAYVSQGLGVSGQILGFIQELTGNECIVRA